MKPPRGEPRGINPQRNEIRRGGISPVEESPVYKEHRIHASRLAHSGHWIIAIVKLGQARAITKDSLTEKVTRVPGGYPSEAEALQAAAQYIDHLEGSE